MAKLQNIQQLIDDKAEARLKKDLEEMRSTIIQIAVLTETNSNFPKIQFNGKEAMPYWFFNPGSTLFYEALYNYWLPIYKSREAQNFIARVEQLEGEVSTLMNSQAYD